MKSIEQTYEKYRWFVTSTNKTVVGGKSASQNGELLKRLKNQTTDVIIMHTSSPGSPFSAILSPIDKIFPQDIEQTAIFTACFSREWREKKKKAHVDIFTLSQLSKPSKLKTGTWNVRGPIDRKSVELKLVLTKQKSKLRAVPEGSVKNSQILLKIKPGKTDKAPAVEKISVLLKDSFSQNEILPALPPGAVEIKKKGRAIK